MKRIPLIAGALLLAVCSSSPAEEAKGSIDWSGGFILATGQGSANPKANKAKARINALRAAEVSAQRALLETIKGVRISSQTTVENSMLTEDIIKTRVDGIVKGAIKVQEQVEEIEGSLLATVTMKICMSSGPAECASKPSLVNALSLEKLPVPAFVPARTLADAVIPPPDSAAPAAAQPSGGYRPPQYDPGKPVTGIVFNLDGRYFERELLPVVVTTASGEKVTVYSVKVVNPSVVRTYGAVRYAETIDIARQNQAAGANPMIISVDDITKENMILIRSSDARLLKENCSHGNNLLGDAKVIISAK